MVFSRRPVRTVLTGKRLFPGVRPNVCLELLLLGSGVRAVRTRERFLPGVDPQVCLQVGVVDRSKGTVWTRKGFLSGVGCQVKLHVAAGGGGVRATRASLQLVNSSHLWRMSKALVWSLFYSHLEIQYLSQVLY